MKTFSEISQIRAALEAERDAGKSIGFVPTMGYFHQGHLSLMHAARGECDVVVISIFVNPSQFGPGEDFASYPRDIERDKKLAEAVGVDYAFVPSVEEIYPDGYSTYVTVEGSLTQELCAAGRPGHFRGCASVVTKLLNIVQPDKAYFGQKDAQQAIIIKKVVEDLNMPVEIAVCPIVREEDGLAMSSRNVYLSPEERKAALVLFRSLRKAEEMVNTGEREAPKIREAMENMICSEPLANLEYVAICDTRNLKEVEKVDGETLIAVAARFGRARLIDNTIIRLKTEDTRLYCHCEEPFDKLRVNSATKQSQQGTERSDAPVRLLR
jgi:pantoate--beta-alanine ligase